MSKMYEIIYITRLTHKQTLNEKMDEAVSLNVWKVKAEETKAQTLNTALTLLYKRLSPTSPAQQLQASSWVQKSVTWILQAIADKCETPRHPLFRLKLICVYLKALRLPLALTNPFFFLSWFLGDRLWGLQGFHADVPGERTPRGVLSTPLHVV